MWLSLEIDHSLMKPQKAATLARIPARNIHIKHTRIFDHQSLCYHLGLLLYAVENVII